MDVTYLRKVFNTHRSQKSNYKAFKKANKTKILMNEQQKTKPITYPAVVYTFVSKI